MKALLFIKWNCAFILMLILSACASDPKYQPIDEDFCAKIHPTQFTPLSKQLEPFHEQLLKQTGVVALEEGDVSMIARAWLTESAESTIDIQYFIFSADNIGLIAVDYLLRAADRGVKVRILVDDIMVEADADDLIALDRHPNMEIKIYNPTANIGKKLPAKLYKLTTDFREFNQRMHNKTFIVDGQVGITGGRNMADEYFDYDHEYNFRDRDVLLMGQVTHTMQASFEQFWTSTLSVPVTELVDVPEAELNLDVKYEYLRQYACNPQNFWPQIREKIASVPVAFERMQQSGDLIWTDSIFFISDEPGKNTGNQGLAGGGIITDSLISLIQNAKSSIYIQSPYLITTDLGQSLFQKTIDRGVSVNILTNSLSSTDNLEAFSGYKRDRESLLKTGIKIFEFRTDAAVRYEVMTGALQTEINYSPIFGLHAKSMVIDQRIAIIGTFNLDPRSANLNTECMAVIYNGDIATRLQQAMQIDMLSENAWQTTLTFNPDSEAGWTKRFKVWMRGVVPKSIL